MKDSHTILLVEDEVLIAMSQKMSLEKYGYTVVIANTGEKAVETVKESNSIDLVLIDIDLGKGIDGTQAARIILAEHDIPIIFMSSHTEPDIVEKTEKITSYGYIVKNSSITVIDASIKMAFKLFYANRKTKQTMNKLKATLNTLPDLLFEIGLDGMYYEIHTHHKNLLYKPANYLTGKNIYSALPPKPAEIIMSAIREAHETGFSTGKKYELEVPEGIRTFELSVSPIESSLDDPHFIFLARDITEREQMQIVLRESEDKYRTVFMISPDVITISTINGVYVDVNESFINLTGYPREEVIGVSASDLKIWYNPKDRVEMINGLRENGFINKMKVVFRTKDGTLKAALLSARIVKINNTQHILAITNDITGYE